MRIFKSVYQPNILPIDFPIFKTKTKIYFKDKKFKKLLLKELFQNKYRHLFEV